MGLDGLNGPYVPQMNVNLSPLKLGITSITESSAKNSFSAGVQFLVCIIFALKLIKFIFSKQSEQAA